MVAMGKIALTEGVGMRGRIRITQYSGATDKKYLMDLHSGKQKSPSGIVVVKKDNLIVNTGLLNLINLLAGEPSAGAIRYMSFGSGGVSGNSVVDPSRTDYKLNTEEFREPVVYTFNAGAPHYSVTFTAAALASEHPDITTISEVGLNTKSVVGTPNSTTLDLFSHVSFPEVFFDATAPVSMGIAVDWEIIFDAV